MLQELGFQKSAGLREYIASAQEARGEKLKAQAGNTRNHFFTSGWRGMGDALGKPNLFPMSSKAQKENASYYRDLAEKRAGLREFIATQQEMMGERSKAKAGNTRKHFFTAGWRNMGTDFTRPNFFSFSSKANRENAEYYKNLAEKRAQ